MSRKKNEHFSGYFDISEICADVILSRGNRGNKSGSSIYITKVLYNNPATVVFWSDGAKTIAKCADADEYNPQIGLLIATLKRFGKISELIDDWAPTSEIYPNYVEVKDVRVKHK